ncbi:MAG: sensor histidine kinase [Candidatus Binatus sp.]|uniref:sensor histidine kinase n=1 Tax=Candidatus Binatus sp. TaxID=2811406 RepID=UPI003BB00716
MRIAQFIRSHPKEIETGWEQFAKDLSVSGPDLTAWALRDHLREILVAMADNMESPQSQEEQSDKSEGKGRRSGALDRISALHARMRLNSGFNLEQAISEYRALRSSILFLWVQSGPSDEDVVLSEVTRFNETIDQAIAEIIRRYADRAERYSDVFLGVLTHEVRNPLNIIKLSGQLLQAAPLQDAQSRSVERILKAVGNVDGLMNDLAILVRSRMRVPLPLRRTAADLGEICEQTLEDVRESQPNVVVDLAKTGDLNGNWDRERLGQVVLNLVMNAVIHASGEKIRVSAEGRGPDVELRVTNQGPSIPPDLQNSIFDPFVRREVASPGLIKSGLGLGLFIVREIVTGHDGVVEVVSTESEGTTFTVRLPRVPRSNAP